ncbi:DUF4399 domain-containing protein [Natronomonas marina]|jgi:hypothetical protein|uniref:DUF4399 domain-containing protein n=1 Tax=Natronomonas marina TaxID=2961939 RepID=UPI0020C96C34|nr:DUF4399 domain-containing protein [Natronomonas marina]
MRESISRRTFAAMAASAATVPLAGCQSDGSGNGNGDGGGNGESSGDGDAPIEYDGDASVAFGTPEDGATAANGVTVSMTAENFTIESSGEVNENSGHFHIVIDEGPVETGETIPNDDSHLHYGDGSTRTVLDLEPGTHELTLQVGDGKHRALPLTDTVEVTVEEASVSFGAPEDGATVESPVAAEFEASDSATVEQAGELSQTGGHFHVMVDTEAVEVGEAIPNDDSHLHFGDGSTSAELELESGEHDLLLQMGDGEHLALPATDEITVTVE